MLFFIADLWLEASVHPVVPVAARLDTRSLGYSSVFNQMLRRLPSTGNIFSNLMSSRLCASRRPVRCFLRDAYKFCRRISMAEGNVWKEVVTIQRSQEALKMLSSLYVDIFRK
jgi:hypothetical protein